MDYSKSYSMFFGLFVILYSQVSIANHVHDQSPVTESNLRRMVVKSTDERILEYKKTFGLFNNGKDGCITTKEFGNIMRSLGHIPTNAELQVIKNEVDIGTSYVVEILNWITEMFIKFDEDHNHVITVDEFRHFARELDKHEMNVETANDAVGAYDSDSDGQLNLDEFYTIVIVMIKDRDKF